MIKKMKVLAVCGNFDDEGGRPSGYMSKLFSYLPQYFSDIRIINGGYYSGLPGMIDPRISGDYDVIFWFANVPNDKSKLLKTIKSRNLLYIAKLPLMLVRPQCIPVRQAELPWAHSCI